MTVSIQLFASLKDAAKASQIEVELPEGADVARLLAMVAREFPALEKWVPHVRVALNEEYATSEMYGKTFFVVAPVHVVYVALSNDLTRGSFAGQICFHSSQASLRGGRRCVSNINRNRYRTKKI